MLLDKKLEDMMNQQYTNEVISALLYKNMAGHYEDLHFTGIASFFHKKYVEELEHAERFYKYINDRDGLALIGGISGEELTFDTTSIVSPFYASLRQEQLVSGNINLLFSVARGLNDYASEQFLLWFVNEQVEEENEFLQLITELELLKESSDGLWSFDRRMSTWKD